MWGWTYTRRRSRWRWRKGATRFGRWVKIPNRPEAPKALQKLPKSSRTQPGCASATRLLRSRIHQPRPLYWQLTKLGMHCEITAPSLVPVKAVNRAKADRRDAEKLARAFAPATSPRCSCPTPSSRRARPGVWARGRQDR
jgi:hypothetical protein